MLIYLFIYFLKVLKNGMVCIWLDFRHKTHFLPNFVVNFEIYSNTFKKLLVVCILLFILMCYSYYVSYYYYILLLLCYSICSATSSNRNCRKTGYTKGPRKVDHCSDSHLCHNRNLYYCIIDLFGVYVVSIYPI